MLRTNSNANLSIRQDGLPGGTHTLFSLMTAIDSASAKLSRTPSTSMGTQALSSVFLYSGRINEQEVFVRLRIGDDPVALEFARVKSSSLLHLRKTDQ